jgi:hypothetical protein
MSTYLGIVEKGKRYDFPFPLDDGTTLWLRLPQRGLTAAERERLVRALEALEVPE